VWKLVVKRSCFMRSHATVEIFQTLQRMGLTRPDAVAR